MAARLVRFQEGMKLGHGYDLLNGVSLASPAVQGAISTIQDAGGSYFGICGDIKVQYARECNLSQFATHVMVHVSVEDAFESFDDPVLTPDANDLLKNVAK